MASFSINLANDGNGVFTPTVLRNATVASGGTVVSLDWVDNTLNGANTSTKLIGTAIWKAFEAMFDKLSTTVSTQTQNWYITITDDGVQNYTPAIRYGGTAATGGTALTIPWVVNTLNGASSTSNILSAILRVTTDAIVNSNSVTGV